MSPMHRPPSVAVAGEDAAHAARQLGSNLPNVRYLSEPVGHSWRDLILFHEYFHGDTGAGIGASHQTGWTAMVAKLMQQGGEKKRQLTEVASTLAAD